MTTSSHTTDDGKCKVCAIVILNWNGSDMMRKYLPSVIRCSQSDGVDVIVADNASTDDSIEMLGREFADIRVIQMDQNYGFAEGYNRALAQLPEYRYHLLLNSDVEIRQEGWIDPMIQYMDEHPECGACQPKLLDLKRADEAKYFEYAGAAGGYLDKYGYPFCRGRIFDVVEEDKGQYDNITPLLWATGAALMVRTADYARVGGLDSRFFAHMEEIDLCWRLRIIGKSIVCIPQSEAWHLGGATLSKGNPRKTFLNFRNNQLMLYKNLPEAELNSILTARRWLDVLASISFLIKGDIANFKAVHEAQREFKRLKSQFKASRDTIQSWRQAENYTATNTPERQLLSILWQYYAKGKKTFKSLEA